MTRALAVDEAKYGVRVNRYRDKRRLVQTMCSMLTCSFIIVASRISNNSYIAWNLKKGLENSYPLCNKSRLFPTICAYFGRVFVYN